MWRRRAVPRWDIQRAKYFSLAILAGENIPGFGELSLEGTRGLGKSGHLCKCSQPRHSTTTSVIPADLEGPTPFLSHIYWNLRLRLSSF